MSIGLGILGAGNMAEAIVRGVLKSGILRPEQILASDVSGQRRDWFQKHLSIRTVDDNRAVARQAAMLLLCVKPQHMTEALDGVGEVIDSRTLVVSIAAGISTRFIENHLGGTVTWRVIRAMPNTPMLVGEGIVAVARGQHATAEDAAAARRLFEAAAVVVDVSEDHMDAVTAVSGSGPAYVFYLVEHMIRAAVELGLNHEQARQFAVQTAIGASKMLAESSESPQELRQKVTSPGGTTQAAISHLDENECAETIVQAIKAAARRSHELGS